MAAKITVLCLAFLALLLAAPGYAASWPNKPQWQNTDFSSFSAPAEEFLPGGPGKDGIRAVDHPEFQPIGDADIDGREPVILLREKGDIRAYPLSIIIHHEIVNDIIAGRPVAVTYCPLCNAAIVFDRRVDGRITSFGVTGILRNADLVMYDRETESWWQQFTGEAIVGARTGHVLTRLPAPLISFDQFKQAYPKGMVLKPPFPGRYRYGRNPYIHYDSSNGMFNVFARLPRGFSRMERVVVVGDQAWRLSALAKAGRIEQGDIRLSWQPGQASALDSGRIADGRDVGTIRAERKNADGAWQEAIYDVTFAFAFAAFKPDGIWHD